MAKSPNKEQTDYGQPYITQEEYLSYKGVDLSVELQNNDRHSDKVNRFIKDITNYVMNWLLTNYACNELNRLNHDFAELPEWRRKRFHYGMIEQIEYVLNNGLLHQDSGVNTDTGSIMDFSKVVISPSAMQEFWLGAFCNVKTEGRHISEDDE